MAVEFVPSTVTQDTTGQASTSGASTSTSTMSTPEVYLTNYARNTPFVTAKSMEQMEAMDVDTNYESHAAKAIRSTIGPIPMEEFFKDACLCPPAPEQRMPDIPEDIFNELGDEPGEDDILRVVVSRFRFPSKCSV